MRTGPLSAAECHALASALGALTATVEAWEFTWSTADLSWSRPTGTLTVRGRHHTGTAELVAFTPEAHAAFAKRVPQLPTGDLPVSAALSGDPAEHAALEAALLDLALHQAQRPLASLVPREGTVSLGLCWSFSVVPSPLPVGRLKLDHHPGATYDGLDLAVLDCKGQSPPEILDPTWIIEDPATPVRAPFALDQPVLSPADRHHPVLGKPTHLNLKAARMGGFLACLQTAALARSEGIHLYWGGQWELGPARRQAQLLAALVCPDAANDLAPIAASFPQSGPNALSVSLDLPGFAS